MERIKRAIIVAAGEGRRLRPLTQYAPKPLIKVNGVRFVDSIIDALKVNGIHEIYIITGYKKEQFYHLYQNDPDIKIIENPNYQHTSNISSIYAARDYLPGAFVIEGDIKILNSAIFDPEIESSGYFASFMDDVPEWAIAVENGRISRCNIDGGKHCYRLWGVSMWSQKDGERLADLVKKYVEEIANSGKYWDEIALFKEASSFNLGIREISTNDMIEIDTFDELLKVDSSYEKFRE